MRFLAVFVILAMVFASPSFAQQVDQADQIDAQRLAEEKRIEEAKRLERVKERVAEAKKVEAEINAVDGKISGINNQLQSLKGEIDRLNEQEASARQRLQKQLDSFNSTALNIARLERMPVEAMVVASSMRVAHDRKGVVESGRKSLSKEIDSNRSDIYELQSIRQKRSEAFAASESLRQNQLNEKEKLELLFNKQVKLLAVDDAEKADLLKKAYKVKQAKNMQAMLKSVEDSEIYMPKARQNLKRMPVQGKIVRGYNQKNEAGMRAQGVSILATSGEEVVAIQDGRIIYSDDFRDYGYIVILEHEDGTHSLYSGMQNSHRALGDFVHAGKKIGVMPSQERPELYLEIRQKGRTINPSVYLASK